MPGKIMLTNQFGEKSENYVTEIADAVAGVKKPEFQFASGACLFSGAGEPDFAAPAGSMFLRTDGSTDANVLYVNHDGSTSWSAR